MLLRKDHVKFCPLLIFIFYFVFIFTSDHEDLKKIKIANRDLTIRQETYLYLYFVLFITSPCFILFILPPYIPPPLW